MISTLIELYEANPCLYNIKDSSYHYRDKKKKAISEIATALGIKGKHIIILYLMFYYYIKKIYIIIYNNINLLILWCIIQ